MKDCECIQKHLIQDNFQVPPSGLILKKKALLDKCSLLNGLSSLYHLPSQMFLRKYNSYSRWSPGQVSAAPLKEGFGLWGIQGQSQVDTNPLWKSEAKSKEHHKPIDYEFNFLQHFFYYYNGSEFLSEFWYLKHQMIVLLTLINF